MVGNRAGCARDSPCAHCARILRNFDSAEQLFTARDKEEVTRKQRKAEKRAHDEEGDEQSVPAQVLPVHCQATKNSVSAGRGLATINE